MESLLQLRLKRNTSISNFIGVLMANAKVGAGEGRLAWQKWINNPDRLQTLAWPQIVAAKRACDQVPVKFSGPPVANQIDELLTLCWHVGGWTLVFEVGRESEKWWACQVETGEYLDNLKDIQQELG